MKIAYAGIDLMSSALDSLIGGSCEILKIFTCPCDNVTEFNTKIVGTAKAHGIEYTVIRVTQSDLEELRRRGCELFLCAGYYYKIPVCDFFPMINLHPAPLPECRGGWPMPQILLGAFDRGGVTAHKIAEGFDTGDILMKKTFPVSESDTLCDYMAKVNSLLPGMIREISDGLHTLYENAVPQGEGRYLPMPCERDYSVDSEMSADEADRIMRAFFGYEIYYTDRDKKYELVFCRAKKGKRGSLPLRDGCIEAERIKLL